MMHPSPTRYKEIIAHFTNTVPGIYGHTCYKPSVMLAHFTPIAAKSTVLFIALGSD